MGVSKSKILNDVMRTALIAGFSDPIHFVQVLCGKTSNWIVGRKTAAFRDLCCTKWIAFIFLLVRNGSDCPLCKRFILPNNTQWIPE